MLFLSSISVLFFLLLLVITLGRRIADFLPKSLKESTAFYIAPLLGLAVLVLITTVYGWLSPFKTGISISIFIGLLVLGVSFEKQRLALFRDWITVFVFALVVTIPIFAPAIRFDGFIPFTDTFTYLVHGQWLQGHAFSQPARASGFFPAETQVALYQAAGCWMGASFFLGFVQSLFHLEWSYYAFLPTVGLVFAVGCFAMGGIIRQVLPASKTICLALCTLPAFSLNGFVWGAQWGFFPQTFGLAFSFGLASLIPGLVTNTVYLKPTWRKQLSNLLPLAICFSAFLVSYNDMFTVLSAGIILFFFLICVFHWKERVSLLGFIIVIVAQVSLLVNIEGFRIFKNIVNGILAAESGTTRWGWPVPRSPIQFIAYSFGMKSPFNNSVFSADKIISTLVFPAFLIMLVIILAKILREKPKNHTILFLMCINVVFWLVFIKFRYAAPGLNGEVGFTFLQFKIAKWLAPFNLALIGIASAWFLLKAGKYKKICKYVFLTVFVLGMEMQFFKISKNFTQQFRGETQRKYSPFNALLDLRSRVESIPKDKVIYLSFGAEHHKLRQMVAYVLSDRKLASEYADDGYILGRIPVNERNMPLETADWLIQFRPTKTIDENPLNRVGPFIILRAPFSFFQLESIKGAYDAETGDNKSWNWVKDSAEYRFRSTGKTSKAKVKFQFLVSGKPRTLFLEFNTYSGKRIASFKIPMPGGWGDYESPSIDTNSEDIAINLSADGEPIRLSDTDSREAKFLIQNLSLDSSL